MTSKHFYQIFCHLSIVLTIFGLCYSQSGSALLSFTDQNCTYPSYEFTYWPGICTPFTIFASTQYSCTPNGFFHNVFANGNCSGTPLNSTMKTSKVNTCLLDPSSGQSYIYACNYSLPPPSEIVASTVWSYDASCTGLTVQVFYYNSRCVYLTGSTSLLQTCSNAGVLISDYNTNNCTGSAYFNSTLPFDQTCGVTNSSCGFLPPITSIQTPPTPPSPPSSGAVRIFNSKTGIHGTLVLWLTTILIKILA